MAKQHPQDFQERRDKILAELRQIKADADHWNRLHPDEEPIVVDLDIGPDVEEALREQRP